MRVNRLNWKVLKGCPRRLWLVFKRELFILARSDISKHTYDWLTRIWLEQLFESGTFAGQQRGANLLSACACVRLNKPIGTDNRPIAIRVRRSSLSPPLLPLLLFWDFRWCFHAPDSVAQVAWPAGKSGGWSACLSVGESILCLNITTNSVLTSSTFKSHHPTIL